ncbi:MAG TPA: hypothetical protein VGQ51_15730 [Puia sp.]|jgi:hypothetical protein|nr:hypothetical protein [Puia sp.]
MGKVSPPLQAYFDQLCAIDPARRPDYIEQAHRLLKPGGKIAGLLFDRELRRSVVPRSSSFVPFASLGNPGGPPFGGHRDEYERLFTRYFNLRTLAPCYNSIPPRAGTELFFIAEKPQAPAGSNNENYPAPI